MSINPNILRHVMFIILIGFSEIAYSQSATEISLTTVDNLIKRSELFKLIPLSTPMSSFLSENRLNILNAIDTAGVNKLSQIDKQVLSKWNEIYSNNLSKMNEPQWFESTQNRISMFCYRDSSFSITLEPVFSLEFHNPEGNLVKYWSNGLNVYGKVEDLLAYHLLFTDNHEANRSISSQKKLSRETGIHSIKLGEYDDFQLSIQYKWSKGNLTIAKDYFKIGSGDDGKIILSDKAPSFPSVSVSYQPVSWLNLFYMHAWLNSGITDSSTVRNSLSSIPVYKYNYDSRKKYLALHTISLLPWENVRLTLGESMVYSDNIEIMYLIPITFFRLADHYSSYGDSGDNAQVFSDLNVLLPSIKTSLYMTLFIDEIQLGKVLSNDPSGHKQFGVTIGGNITDYLMDNTKIVLEYSRINPFVYHNFNPAQTFESTGYQLGHWIGSNADQIHFSWSKMLSSKTSCKLQYDYIRKGGEENIDDQYSIQNPPFLFGKLSELSTISFRIVYEPIYPIQLIAEFEKRLKSTNRFITEYGLEKRDYIRLKMSYGL